MTKQVGCPTEVTLDVISPRGSRVRRVLDETRVAGLSSAAWDGRDDAGRSVTAGIYFVVLRSSGEVTQTKVVRLP